VGYVSKGQTGEFTVDAFPDRKFEGTVAQVRQAPITVQNVVTYDVVVTVANPELLLKPGMTANVTIVTAKRDEVTRVPLQALRFSPQAVRAAKGGGVLADGAVANRARVWVPTAEGVAPVVITTGLDDGNYVELISGQLQPGDKVVTDEVRAGGSTAAPASALHFPH